MPNIFKICRRRLISRKPVPQEWSRILTEKWPMFTRLPSEDKQELLEHIKVFLAEKHFEGCGGLQITEEIKLIIAAQACLLLLHRQSDYYPGICSILVYPTAYLAPAIERTSYMVVTEGKASRAGEAWQDGAIVLSLDNILSGVENATDGSNVVLHEFAHALDMEDTSAWGVPVLRRSQYAAWAKVLSREYLKLQSQVKEDAATVLDRYGAENPAEFFAVATECFFEKPKDLKEKHPALYGQLQAYYRQDPIQFITSSTLPKDTS